MKINIFKTKKIVLLISLFLNLILVQSKSNLFNKNNSEKFLTALTTDVFDKLNSKQIQEAETETDSKNETFTIPFMKANTPPAAGANQSNQITSNTHVNSINTMENSRIMSTPNLSPNSSNQINPSSNWNTPIISNNINSLSSSHYNSNPADQRMQSQSQYQSQNQSQSTLVNSFNSSVGLQNSSFSSPLATGVPNASVMNRGASVSAVGGVTTAEVGVTSRPAIVGGRLITPGPLAPPLARPLVRPIPAIPGIPSKYYDDLDDEIEDRESINEIYPKEIRNQNSYSHNDFNLLEDLKVLNSLLIKNKYSQALRNIKEINSYLSPKRIRRHIKKALVEKYLSKINKIELTLDNHKSKANSDKLDKINKQLEILILKIHQKVPKNVHEVNNIHSHIKQKPQEIEKYTEEVNEEIVEKLEKKLNKIAQKLKNAKQNKANKK